MEDNKKYWLNEFGLRRWQHKTLPYELERQYHWFDTVSLLGNSTPSNPGRRYQGYCWFSTLEELNINSIDGDITFTISDFEIIDKKYERRKKLLKLNKIMKKKFDKY